MRDTLVISGSEQEIERAVEWAVGIGGAGGLTRPALDELRRNIVSALTDAFGNAGMFNLRDDRVALSIEVHGGCAAVEIHGGAPVDHQHATGSNWSHDMYYNTDAMEAIPPHLSRLVH